MVDQDAVISDMKRLFSPEGFGDECPVCGEPFDPGSAGVVWPDEDQEIDAISWVKVCYGPVAPHIKERMGDMDHDPEDLAMVYIHKDDSAVGGETDG